ncbi:MAG: hypothetical protein Kow0026_12350 [Oricola sp.]
MKQAGRHSRAGQVRAATSLACVLALSGPAFSKDEAPAPHLSLELNAMQQLEDTCRIVFLVENRLGADLDALSYETVLIDTDGVVDRLTLFDFRALPEGRARVRQFDLDNAQCSRIGRVLINGAAACKGEGLSGDECIDKLTVSSKTATGMAG